MRTGFRERVLSVVKGIPKGETLSYGQVASLAGAPGAARAVGNIMANNFDEEVPCHRVIKADGSLGGYNGNLGEKEALLRKEGAI